jgi:hypothetical protein
MERGLNALQGRDVQIAFDVLGYPSGKQEFGNDIVYYWQVDSSGAILLPQTSTTTGYVGMTPVYGSTTYNQVVPVNYNCLIKLVTDDKGVIKTWEYNGNYGGCASYIKRLNRYYNQEEAPKFKTPQKIETKEAKSNMEQGNKFILFDEQSMNDKRGYVPSGWMGDYQAIKIEYNYTNNPHSGLYCQKWFYSGKKTNGQGWGGVFWQNPPNNWGNVDGGFNLSKFSKLTFWARGENGGEVLTFGMGGITGRYSDSAKAELSKIALTKEWKQYTIDLKDKNLARIIGGFFWTVNEADNPNGCTFYLDDIAYE